MWRCAARAVCDAMNEKKGSTNQKSAHKFICDSMVDDSCHGAEKKKTVGMRW